MILAHVLIGVSLFFTNIVRLIPLPVLTGVFLYLGVVTLSGQQFILRLLLLFMRVKNQPDYRFLRNVKMRRVHIFTLVQLASLVALYVLKSVGPFKIAFPVMASGGKRSHF